MSLWTFTASRLREIMSHVNKPEIFYACWFVYFAAADSFKFAVAVVRNLFVYSMPVM